MKVLVYAHHLELGGTQTNAIELAASVRDRHGHDVTLFATPGPAAELIPARQLRYLEAPTVTRHPSVAMVRALASVVRRERPDVIHVWDWPQILDAYYGVHLPLGTPLLCTCMSMVVPRFLPSSQLTTFGTPELVEQGERRTGAPALLLEPPVDTVHNAPGAVDTEAFRQRWGLGPGATDVVVVSRLTSRLKLEGLLRSIQAIDQVAERHTVRLTIVGEGTAADELARAADRVNARHGRRVVTMTGGMIDPRPAYASADLILGMGGSSLRAMAFGQPLIILGERGYSRVFEPDSADEFLYRGMYGLGDGDLDPAPLVEQIESLATDPGRRNELGRFGLDLVRGRYGLDATADRLEGYYRQAVDRRIPRRQAWRAASRTTGLRAGDLIVPEPLKQRLRQLTGKP
jgi:glycosyltransferase involved in cell wall biosynthesis